MTFGIIASLALSLLVAWFLISPLLDAGGGPGSTPSGYGEAAALLDAKERSLRAIKDLELDFSMGKVSQDDFERSREALSLELISILDRVKNTGGADESA